MTETIHILTGPTGVGKTEIAMDWAESNGAEILSCDSLLVYHGMDVGTAKPSPESMKRIPHHGIDVADLSTVYSVGDYVKLAENSIGEIRERGKKTLVVGGSGFYLRCFFNPVVDDLKIPKEVAERVERLNVKKGLDGLVEELRRLNPSGLGNLDTRNPRRVANALKRCLASGRTVIELKKSFSKGQSPFTDYRKQVCCLMRSPKELRSRIEDRTRSMMDAGLIEEVERLISEGLESNLSAGSAIGYRETIAHLNGDITQEELENEIVRNTVALAKKQLKWIQRQIPVDHEVYLRGGERLGELFLE